MNWLTLAQSIPDAAELASGDAQQILAWMVGALMLAVVGLFALLVKAASGNRAEIKAIYDAHKIEDDAELVIHKAELDKLNEKNDKLQERLLRYVANLNSMLTAAQAAAADPLDLGGNP